MGVPHSVKVKNGHKSLLRDILRGVLPDYIVDAPKSGLTMNLLDFFAKTFSQADVSRFLQGSTDLIGDTVSGSLAQRIKND